MPSWHTILEETAEAGTMVDAVRRRYLAGLAATTGRPTVLYASSWLQKGQTAAAQGRVSITDDDKNGFMTVMAGLDRDKGLDLVLHTPGGDMSATESLIAYVRGLFGTNLRAIVPLMAMSGGTLLSCACETIFMGEQSCLGPFDPQVAGVPAQAIVEEFARASREIDENPARAALWQPILEKLNPGSLDQCEKVIALADEVATDSLATGMFRHLPDANERASKVVDELGSHAITKLHSRHIHRGTARGIGLTVTDLESDPALNDAVMAVHHATMLSFMRTDALKLVENHLGTSFITR